MYLFRCQSRWEELPNGTEAKGTWPLFWVLDCSQGQCSLARNRRDLQYRDFADQFGAFFAKLRWILWVTLSYYNDSTRYIC